MNIKLKTYIKRILFLSPQENFEVASNTPVVFRACLHGVGDPGLVRLVSFVFTLWGTQNKRNLPH